MMSARAAASSRMNCIRLPGIRVWGLASQASSVVSVQTTVLVLMACEYRSKSATLPALRPITPLRLGPVMWWPS